MIDVGFHRLAANELRAARRKYRKIDAALALRFQSALESAIDRIRKDPGSHPVASKHFRWVRLRRFPYRLIFEYDGAGSILILAMAHTSRRPEYWIRRR